MPPLPPPGRTWPGICARPVAGLERLEARPSQLRLLGLASLLLLASLGYWSLADLAPAILAALGAGLAYTLLLLTSSPA